MQKVSKAYKESMKSPLRERGYIMISFGLINQEAQAKATVNTGDYTEFSNLDLFEERVDDIVYSTLEEGFTKADGSMLFLPRPSTGGYINTGLISNKLVSDARCEVEISLNTKQTKFKGLTIVFGENYPVDFDVIGSDGQTLQYRGNTKSQWSTEDVLKNTNSVRLVFYKMKNEHSRLRIYSIKFGYGLIYRNDSVIDSKLDSFVSPIGAAIPQIDFSVTLKNYDNYFNVDNPNSAVNYLETGQEMDIVYGYQLPNSNKIEWVQGCRLWCSAWESDDNSATIRCHDIFRNMGSEYKRGTYSENGESYYNLAKSILDDAGVEEYYIDPRLKKLFTKNPIPKIRHKEALQIIANACRCTLSQSRYGKIEIKSNFIPEITVSTNGETRFSKVSNIIKDKPVVEYSTLAKEYSSVDGTMFFLPRGESTLETGYVSDKFSNEQGSFEENPIVTFSMDGIRSYYGLKFLFGEVIPREFIVRSYNESVLVNEYEVLEDEIEKETVVLRDFDDCNKIQVEFTRTSIPFNRIVLNSFSINDTTNFEMRRHDMKSSPKVIKQELIKEVIVPCFTYQKNDKIDTLVNTYVDAEVGKTDTFYIQDASYDYTAKLNEQSSFVDVLDSASFYVTVKYKRTGNFKLEIQGRRYKVVERTVIKELNTRGKTVKWKNPLISDMKMASDLADWLGEYYKSNVEYEYKTRGNPELDANDLIYQESEFYKDMKVNVYKLSLGFNKAFSGQITARKVGGVDVGTG